MFDDQLKFSKEEHAKVEQTRLLERLHKTEDYLGKMSELRSVDQQFQNFIDRELEVVDAS